MTDQVEYTRTWYCSVCEDAVEAPVTGAPATCPNCGTRPTFNVATPEPQKTLTPHTRLKALREELHHQQMLNRMDAASLRRGYRRCKTIGQQMSEVRAQTKPKRRQGSTKTAVGDH
jgi:hypothetical protein